MKAFIIGLALLAAASATSALAQQAQPPDPAFLQRALTAMQGQRNQAMDALAISEAKTAGVAEELAKTTARVKELEAKEQSKGGK